ncbi:hypothetical protein N665_0283s0003 [Sinapis alba]|nr:hypothetical protein N665_0283s0003 [Sinapis alba]
MVGNDIDGSVYAFVPRELYQSVPREPHQSVSASCASVFSSQWNEDGNEDEEIVSDRKERRKWSLTEDVVLISAWLNTSKDPINEGVCKFVGCYEAATKQRSSGQNEDDVLKMAHAIYFNDYKKKYTLEHAWLELRHDQKWSGALATKDKVQCKRRKLDDQTTQPSSFVSHGEEAMDQPVGVKAAKAKGKKPVSKKATLEEEEKERMEFRSIWDIRQADFTLKATLNKQKLLDNLIAKTEPLSELEIGLKTSLLVIC